MNRPIIFKVLTTFDKELIYQNIAKLKKFYEDRDSKVFVTDHLPKVFYNHKKVLLPEFHAAKRDKKSVCWGAFEGEYCLYVNNKRIRPPHSQKLGM